MRTRTQLMRRLALLVAVLGLVLAACGEEGDDATENPAQDDTEAEDTGDDAGDTEAAADGDGEVVEVTLRDYEFGGLPETVAAGTRFTVVNEAQEELHELVAFRLPDGEDRPVAELAELPPEELVEILGEPAAVVLAEPGGPAIPAVGDGTLTEPGRYAIMCFIPTGADPQEYLEAAAEAEEGPPQVEGGPPHFVHGMHAEITVE